MKKRILCLFMALVLVCMTSPGLVRAEATVSIETNPVAGTAYKLGMCISDGTTLYFDGNTESKASFRLTSTSDITQAVDVYLEEADGGLLLYFMKGSTKTYIRVFEYNTTEETGSVELTTTVPTDYLAHDAAANTLVHTGKVGSYYLGAYRSWTTFRASNTSYITGSNAANIGVSQYPARLYKVAEVQEFDSVSVALEDKLSVRFYANVDDGIVKIAVGDAPEVEVAPSVSSAKPGCKEYSVSVFAEDMLMPITATIYATDGKVLDQQVFDFAAYVDSMSGQSPAMQKLAQATLTYCQYTARLAGKFDGALSPLADIPGDAFTDFPMAPSTAPSGTSIFARLTEACSLRMRLLEPYDVTVDGQPAELVQSGQRYECGAPQILPQDYGKSHNFTLSRDGAQVYTGDFSVMAYMGVCLQRGLGTPEQQDLLKAMYHYYTAAYAVAYPAECTDHIDSDNDEYCDRCGESVVVIIDFYSINDLHGKIMDSDAQIGVDELSTYLSNARTTDDNVVLLSAGDMWQGSAESSLTRGHLVTDWMNGMDFDAMVLGNHEFDWGSDRIREHDTIAQFPYLAINVYEHATDAPVEYCQPSLMVERDGVQIGLIGAIGNCYSSISSDKVTDVYFKVGDELTELVKAESEKLRSEGADLIVYTVHGDYDDTNTYDTALSNGYVDVVFEGHTHTSYLETDAYGVYHMQNGGDNADGISHVEFAVNTASDTHTVTTAELVGTDTYSYLEDDPIVRTLQDKYATQLAKAEEVLSSNVAYQSSSALCQAVASQYYTEGVKLWGDQYDIVLGGGYLNTRSPYTLPAGTVTYGQLISLFPFDNEIVLCSISGQKLQNQFFNKDSYSKAYGEYGQQVKDNLDTSATYYVVVDMYTAVYSANGLTIVDYYTKDVFARDLLAQYIRDGNLDQS